MTGPELTEDLLRTLPVPIAAAIHQLKLKYENQRRQTEAAERRQEELRTELVEARATTSGAYRERAHLVALLGAVYPSEMHENPDADYPDWPIVMVQTPTGQMAWHLSPDDTELFPHVKYAATVECNHSTEEKYARMRHLTAQTAAATKHGAENAQALDELRGATRRFLATYGGEPQ